MSAKRGADTFADGLADGLANGLYHRCWKACAGAQFYRANGDVPQAEHNAAVNVRGRLDTPAISRFTPYGQGRRILVAFYGATNARMSCTSKWRGPSTDKPDEPFLNGIF